MRLANYPILVYPTAQDEVDGLAVFNAIGSAYYESLGYTVLQNPPRVVPKNIKTGVDNFEAQPLPE